MNNIRIVVFTIPNCAPCNQIKPILKELSETVEVESINAMDNKELSIQYGIRKAPTVIILKDGVEINRFTGFKTKDEIEELLN